MDKRPSLGWVLARSPFSGGEWYRATRPAALAYHHFGWDTAPCTTVGDIEGTDKVALGVWTPEGWDPRPCIPDIIILRPIAEWTPEWTERAHRNGQFVVADIDDSPWDHPLEDEKKKAQGHEEGWMDHFEEWFPTVDAVLASTPALAKRLRELGMTMPIRVAPNCFDPFGMDAQPDCRSRKLGTRLWLRGRMDEDIQMYYDLVFPICRELGLTFTHIGAFNYDGTDIKLGGTHRFKDVGNKPDYKGPPISAEEAGQWHTIKGGPILEERNSVDLLKMSEELVELSVGVIMMADHPFNDAKTETTAVEMGCSGLPFVAVSNHPLYRDIPGRVLGTKTAVRERIISLLPPNDDYWLAESKRIKKWARAKALKYEAQYLSALLATVRELLGPQPHSPAPVLQPLRTIVGPDPIIRPKLWLPQSTG